MATKRCKLSKKEYLQKVKTDGGYRCKKCERLGAEKQLCKAIKIK